MSTSPARYLLNPGPVPWELTITRPLGSSEAYASWAARLIRKTVDEPSTTTSFEADEEEDEAVPPSSPPPHPARNRAETIATADDGRSLMGSLEQTRDSVQAGPGDGPLARQFAPTLPEFREDFG